MKRLWRPLLGLAVAACLGGAFYCMHLLSPPAIDSLTLDTGAELLTVSPPQQPRQRVLVIVPGEFPMDTDELMRLALNKNAQLRLLRLPESCPEQASAYAAALEHYNPDAVAGIEQGAAWAQHWLVGQSTEQAYALSVGYRLDNACTPAAPIEHGHWEVVWNDNPDDDTARFVRAQERAESDITPYDQSLGEVLSNALYAHLEGNTEGLPLVEIPAGGDRHTLILLYSGDGGWRDLDRELGNELARLGYPVVGVDCLRYYWRHRSPQASAADLSALMRRYQHDWGIQQVVLLGFSFGADILPSIYNLLPSSVQKGVSGILLLAPGHTGSFEIKIQGWLGKAGQEVDTIAELRKLPSARTLCVYGKDEAAESACTASDIPGTVWAMPGGHHFDENYAALAQRVTEWLEQRPTDSGK